MAKKEKTTKWEEAACDFENEDECEEDLDEEEVDFEKEEGKEYGEENNS